MGEQAVQIADSEMDYIREILREHGATLEFMHAGVFREQAPDGSSRYITDVFGRFSSNTSNTVVVGLDYLDLAARFLNALPSNIVNDPIKAKAGPAIAVAIHNCKIYRPHITNPASRLHLAR